MLAYASTARPGARAGSARTLMVIVAGHAAVLAAVLAAKPELVGMTPFVPIKVIDVRIDPPPPEVAPPQPQANLQPVPIHSRATIPTPIVDNLPSLPIVPLAPGPAINNSGGAIGLEPGAQVVDPPEHAPVRVAAVFRTPESAIKPPYPLSKIRSEEEATLRLRLSIDPRGRVVAVDPVGDADAEFLAAARRHIMQSWRYKPAMEDGIAVASSTVISLSFRLDDASA